MNMMPDEHRIAADALAAQVIARAQAGGIAISREIRRETIALIRRLKPLSPVQFPDQFLRGFRLILQRYEPILAATIRDSQIGGWIHGAQAVMDQVPEPPLKIFERVPEVPPWTQMIGQTDHIVDFPIIREGAASLAKRKVITSNDYYALDARARMEAFTVSRITSLDALEKVREALIDAVAHGGTVEAFKRQTLEAFEGSGLGEQRQELVFRNAVMGSYARGQKAMAEVPLVRSYLPFAWRSEINDSRLTHLCYALSHSGIQGTSIYCVDDPVWAKVAPQSHHACRCGVILLTVERAAAKGLKVAQKWLSSGVRPSDWELYVPFPNLANVPTSERHQFDSWVSPWAA
jgi:hypothetical protein